MGRGYIYEVTDDINYVGDMSEEDFYECLAALSVDYVANMNEDDQAQMRNDFIQTLEASGAIVNLIKEDAPIEFPDGVYAVSGLNNTFKENYFRERYKRMKELAESITLEQFAVNSTDMTLYYIKKAIEDDYGDMIYLNGSYSTVDYFIRHADPEKTYYFENVVYLH